MTWLEAQSYCREHFTDLASIRDENEHQVVSEKVDEKHSWIGLYRKMWNTWSDGSDSSYRRWMSDRPSVQSATTHSQACAVLEIDLDMTWSDKTCAQALPFICNAGEFLILLDMCLSVCLVDCMSCGLSVCLPILLICVCLSC